VIFVFILFFPVVPEFLFEPAFIHRADYRRIKKEAHRSNCGIALKAN